MSQLLINKYLGELATLKKVSGTHRESVVREAFKDLLKAWGRSLDLTFIPEYELETKTKERRYVDGALLHTLRVPFGYWEAKDEKDDLDAEIAHKFKRGYPLEDAEAWWRVIWYAGFRGLVAQLGDAELARFKQEHLAEISALHNGQGIPLNVTALFASGRVA